MNLIYLKTHYFNNWKKEFAGMRRLTVKLSAEKYKTIPKSLYFCIISTSVSYTIWVGMEN